MENPIRMDDLGVPIFLETPIWYDLYLSHCYPATSFDLRLGEKERIHVDDASLKTFVEALLLDDSVKWDVKMGRSLFQKEVPGSMV